MSDDRFKDGNRAVKCRSLCEYLRSVVDDQGTDSEAFKVLEELLGKEKLREMYRKAKAS